MRVAAVDLGTDTTRLLVADIRDGRVEDVVRREVITRMGEAVDRRRILLPTSIARVRIVVSLLPSLDVAAGIGVAGTVTTRPPRRNRPRGGRAARARGRSGPAMAFTCC